MSLTVQHAAKRGNYAGTQNRTFFQHVMTVGRGLGTVKDGPGKVEEEQDICMMLPCGLGTWLLANKVTRNKATGNAGSSETGAGILCDYMGRG